MCGTIFGLDSGSCFCVIFTFMFCNFVVDIGPDVLMGVIFSFVLFIDLAFEINFWFLCTP